MKHANQLLEKLSNQDLIQLTTEVKEILDVYQPMVKAKTFTAAELWDIYRRRKNTFVRRRQWVSFM